MYDRKPGLGKWIQDFIKLTLYGPTVFRITTRQGPPPKSLITGHCTAGN